MSGVSNINEVRAARWELAQRRKEAIASINGTQNVSEQVVRVQHAATFFEQAKAADDAGLPQFVKDEFDAFLECGMLANCFLRLHCGDCGYDRLVAFSCKRRGFCPSCGARPAWGQVHRQ